jgi:hypothetical protein
VTTKLKQLYRMSQPTKPSLLNKLPEIGLDRTSRRKSSMKPVRPGRQMQPTSWTGQNAVNGTPARTKKVHRVMPLLSPGAKGVRRAKRMTDGAAYRTPRPLPSPMNTAKEIGVGAVVEAEDVEGGVEEEATEATMKAETTTKRWKRQ